MLSITERTYIVYKTKKKYLILLIDLKTLFKQKENKSDFKGTT